MNEKERTELEALRKKEQKTEAERARYRELLEKLFDEELYYGGHEED